MNEPAPDSSPASSGRTPRDDELDVYGLSHTGKVRAENQDHFLLATVHRRLQVLQTSLAPTQLPLVDQRIAFIAMIADGVGGGVGGEQASATTLQVATEYLASTSDCFYRASGAESGFIDALQVAAQQCHEAVRQRASTEAEGRTMATTLTLWMGAWPWYYLLQVGDSRYYLYREGTLTQITRDQTVAQDLVDSGVFTRTAAASSRFAHVLSSAIGGDTAEPVVTRLRADWHNVHLLCTDGLTRHVSDERIQERLSAMTSSRQVCEQLLDDALDGGGRDNISIIVGRAVPGAGLAASR